VLVSAEALVRWKHSELGMISPGEFIPLFERTGRISELDIHVWREAARQIATWRDKYGKLLPVSVNLSRLDVFSPNLFETLDGIVKLNNLSTSCLKLEVTESAYTDNPEQLIEVIHKLRAKGYKIEMDDFGSGYSSLNMLSSLPMDVLKMDIAFIRNIEHSPKDLRLVELVVDIARYLNVPVVAEGVETEGQIRLLRKEGCDIVQGFYFSRPLPAADFENNILKPVVDKEKAKG
jgi:EAL domain-containing protein (putative c-di-GMP-specific phosphodiesterase class I)